MCKDIIGELGDSSGYDEFYEKFGRMRKNKCRPDCHNRYYNYNFDSQETNETDHMINIYIHHNQLPDQLTEHIEDMTFTYFFGTFGDLFGIWLGLSALIIFKTMSEWIMKKRNRKKKTNDEEFKL